MKIVIRLIAVIGALLFAYAIFFTDPSVRQLTAVADDGVLDLLSWSPDETDMVLIVGDWELYLGALLTPREISEGLSAGTLQADAHVPFNEIGPGENFRDSNGLWTYRLLVRMSNQDRMFGLSFLQVEMANRVYVNGVHYGGSGIPDAESAAYQRKPMPFQVYFPLMNADESGQGTQDNPSDEVPDTPAEDLAEIVIQVANHDFIIPGSIPKITLGTLDAIHQQNVLRTSIEFSAALVCVQMAVFSFMLFRAKIQENQLKYLAVFFISLAVLFMNSSIRIVYLFLPNMPFLLSLRLSILSILVVFFSMLAFMKQAEPDILCTRGYRIFLSVLGASALFYLIAPFSWNLITLNTVTVAILVFSFILNVRAFYLLSRKRIMLQERRLSAWHYIALVSHFFFTLNQLLFNNNITALTSLGSIGMMLLIMAATLIVGQRFVFNYRQQLALEKLRDDFVTRTSYELKSPLQNIVNLSEAYFDPIEEESDEGIWEKDQVRVRARQIHVILSRLIETIDLAWDATLLGQGQVEIEKEPITLYLIADIAIESVQFYNPMKEISYLNEIGHDIVVSGDEGRVRQILFYLLLNAANSMEKGQVRLNAKAAGKLIRVSVIDNGYGFSEDVKENLFESNYGIYGDKANVGITEDNSRLGLVVSRRLAELMEGTLELAYTEVGVGSVFTLSLVGADGQTGVRDNRKKRAKGDSVLKLANLAGLGRSLIESSSLTIPQRARNHSRWDQWPKRSKSKNQVILILDRELHNLSTATAILRRAGYTVVSMQSSDAIIDDLARIKPDLLILDILLHRVSGLDLSRQIRKQWTFMDLPILVTSVSSSNLNVELALEAGANDFITKPFEAWSLTARVNTLMSLRTAMMQAVSNELAYLNAQIKPHFLFNAISTITYFCHTDSEMAAKLLTRFSRYLRLTLDTDKDNDTVELSRELELVEVYFELEKARFEDRINLSLDVDPSLEAFHIPLLCLQPLVENAVKHGLLKKDGGGLVTISAKAVQNKVELRVSDDGCGMDEHVLAMLLGDAHSRSNIRATQDQNQGIDPLRSGERSHGVAVINVRKRIEQTPGAELEIQSIPEEGTTVILRFEKT